LIGGGYIGGISHSYAIIIGYLLSFVFVGSNLFFVQKTSSWAENRFYRFYFVSLALRFLLILIVLVVVFKTIKIHQIYFTVSFIISYILHSVIEIFSINKIFETDN
jgi:hypothetical protein